MRVWIDETAPTVVHYGWPNSDRQWQREFATADAATAFASGFCVGFAAAEVTAK